LVVIAECRCLARILSGLFGAGFLELKDSATLLQLDPPGLTRYENRWNVVFD
jgi:hypothetical protein